MVQIITYRKILLFQIKNQKSNQKSKTKQYLGKEKINWKKLNRGHMKINFYCILIVKKLQKEENKREGEKRILIEL